MKILHINSYYYSSLFYKNLYNLQEKTGTKIDVFVPVSTTSNNKNFDYGNYTLISKNHSKYDRLCFFIKHFKILKDIKQKYNINNYDLIHAHSLFSNGYIAYKLFLKYKVPYVVAVRNTDVNVFFKKMFFLRKLGINILKNAKEIIFISDTYKKETFDKYIPKKYHEILTKKTHVVPNGIDNYWIDNHTKKSKTITDKNVNVVFAGRIDKNKNIIPVVKACNLLKKDGYNVKFTIVGKTLDYSELKKALEYGFVEYLDMQPKEKLLDIYNKSHIFAMASQKETFGLVYAEAITQGLPIIYTKNQGFDGQFDEGTVGYHVDCLNINDIYLKLKMIIKNYDELVNNCLKFYNKYNWENISDIYMKIYKGDNYEVK